MQCFLHALRAFLGAERRDPAEDLDEEARGEEERGHALRDEEGGLGRGLHHHAGGSHVAGDHRLRAVVPEERISSLEAFE